MGVYVHIPFCIKKCGYCDFYSVYNVGSKAKVLEAILYDIELRKEILRGHKPSTVYFGGGTPSVYSPNDIQKIIDKVKKVFEVDCFDEITIEINPEDVTLEYIEELCRSDVSRVSLGVQSFNDETLKFMKRRHTSEKAVWAVKELQKNGFDNISIDLIYGVPGVSFEGWNSDLNRALTLNIQHISAYHLTIEQGTAFGRLEANGKIKAVEESVSERVYNDMIDTLKSDFIHYEISNFAINRDYVSKHNLSYWTGVPYLGVGPSAHSFDGVNERSWCVSSIEKYVSCVLDDSGSYIETEILTDEDIYYEYIMLSLRRIDGVNLVSLKERFSDRYDAFLKNAERFIKSKDMILKGNNIMICEKSLLLADYIIRNCIE